MERSRQWCSLVVPFPADVVAAIARAVRSALSQLEAAVTGDHDRRRIPDGKAVGSPEGSNTHTCPTRERARHVASSTSRLVAVETTGPGAASSAGMTIVLVFPERGGPRIITACSGSAVTQRPPG